MTRPINGISRRGGPRGRVIRGRGTRGMFGRGRGKTHVQENTDFPMDMGYPGPQKRNVAFAYVRGGGGRRRPLPRHVPFEHNTLPPPPQGPPLLPPPLVEPYQFGPRMRPPGYRGQGRGILLPPPLPLTPAYIPRPRMGSHGCGTYFPSQDLPMGGPCPRFMPHFGPRPIRTGRGIPFRDLRGMREIRKLKVPSKSSVSPQQTEMTKPWVTEAMKNEILKKHKLHQKAKKTKAAEDWEAFKEQRNKVTTMLREAKIEYIGAHTEDDVEKILAEADKLSQSNNSKSGTQGEGEDESMVDQTESEASQENVEADQNLSQIDNSDDA